jgi:hypothetical protein
MAERIPQLGEAVPRDPAGLRFGEDAARRLAIPLQSRRAAVRLALGPGGAEKRERERQKPTLVHR